MRNLETNNLDRRQLVGLRISKFKVQNKDTRTKEYNY